MVKQSFFGLPGQYGRRVTKANSRNKSSSKGDSYLTNRFGGKLSGMRADCLGLKHCKGSEGRNFSVSV